MDPKIKRFFGTPNQVPRSTLPFSRLFTWLAHTIQYIHSTHRPSAMTTFVTSVLDLNFPVSFKNQLSKLSHHIFTSFKRSTSKFTSSDFSLQYTFNVVLILLIVCSFGKVIFLFSLPFVRTWSTMNDLTLMEELDIFPHSEPGWFWWKFGPLLFLYCILCRSCLPSRLLPSSPIAWSTPPCPPFLYFVPF